MHVDKPGIIWSSETEEAKRLSVSAFTLQNWRRQGKGPPYAKFEGTVRYNPLEVDNWVREQTRLHREPAPDGDVQDQAA